jgi:Uma2 family endonuclease
MGEQVILKREPRRFDLKSIDLPYTLKLYGVTEAKFDELVDEDTRADLIDGVMIVHSPASLRHDGLGNFVRGLTGLYADEKELGTVFGPDGLIHLATCRQVCPDGFFIRRKRVPRRLPKKWEGTPDFILEILSPSNRHEDLQVKLPAYHVARVPEMWVLDMDEERAVVHRSRRSRYAEEVVTSGRVTSEVLTGFWLDVAWLWAEPLPKQLNCLRTILREE